MSKDPGEPVNCRRGMQMMMMLLTMHFAFMYNIAQRQNRPDPFRKDSINPRPYERTVYFSFFALAPLTFAVPRRVFCRFLRCLPVCLHFTSAF